MPLVWACWCPCGDVCGKKNRMLKKKLSEEDARWAVTNHLMTSPSHMMSQEEAEATALVADIESWEEDEESWQRWGEAESASEGGKGDGKGDGKGKKGGKKRDRDSMEERVART
eukprot:13608072-Alexandrium_andersonii.AAC.1